MKTLMTVDQAIAGIDLRQVLALDNPDRLSILAYLANKRSALHLIPVAGLLISTGLLFYIALVALGLTILWIHMLYLHGRRQGAVIVKEMTRQIPANARVIAFKIEATPASNSFDFAFVSATGELKSLEIEVIHSNGMKSKLHTDSDVLNAQLSATFSQWPKARYALLNPASE